MNHAPYKYLDYYDFEDADIFFGREEETQRMVGEILSTRLLVLFSPSGSGKTSLINAGVRPQLEKMGYKTIYTRLESEPISAVCRAIANALDFPCEEKAANLYEFLKKAAEKSDKPLVIFLDQFEEFFTVFRDEPKTRKEFIEQIAKIKYDDNLPTFIVISMRDDYYVKLFEFRYEIPSIFKNSQVLLGSFSREEARQVIANPAANLGVKYEDGLIETILNELEDSNHLIEIISLQLICNELWNLKSPDSNIITFEDFESIGGINTFLKDRIEKLIEKIPKHYYKLMLKLFNLLKTKEETKRFVKVDELYKKLSVKDKNKEDLNNLLEKLTELNILRQEKYNSSIWYEFRHDYIVSEINSWIQKRKELLIRKRFNYIIAPIFISVIIIILWAVIQFNRFEARFTEQKYNVQQQEVVIVRKFNPFDFRITTGILYEDLKDLESRNLIMKSYTISKWGSKNWNSLAEKLSPECKMRFMQHIGIIDGKAKESENRFDKDIIDKLILDLKSDVPIIRFQAFVKLLNLNSNDDRVIDALTSTLKDIWPYWNSAISVIANNNLNNYKLIKSLINLLNENRWGRRTRELSVKLILALSKMGKINDQVIEAFINELNNRKSKNRAVAALVLGNIGKADSEAISSLIAALKDENIYLRVQAIEALGKIGKSNEIIINALLNSSRDESNLVRSKSIWSICEIGYSDSKIIKVLLDAMHDIDWDVRYQAVTALGNIRQYNNQFVEKLLGLLRDKNFLVRNQVIKILSNSENINNLLIKELIDIALDNSNISSSLLATEGLINLSKIDPTILKLLSEIALTNENSDFSKNVVWSLINFSKGDTSIINALYGTLENYGSSIRVLTAEKLIKFGYENEHIKNVLMTELNNNMDSKVRSKAAEVLGSLHNIDERVINSLITQLKDGDLLVRNQVALSLGNLGKADEHVLDALVAALKDQSSSVRYRAAAALGKLLRYNSQERLFKYIKGELSGYRTAGAQALARQDSISDYILDEINRLKDKDKRPWVRLGAWEAYELIQQRLEDEKEAYQFIHKADSLFEINKFSQAEKQYQSAFDQLTKIIRIDSLKIGKTKLQQARCTAKQNKKIPTLDNLETAFQYNPALRYMLWKEMRQQENDWAFLRDNWYLNEVLLKKATKQ